MRRVHTIMAPETFWGVRGCFPGKPVLLSRGILFTNLVRLADSHWTSTSSYGSEWNWRLASEPRKEIQTLSVLTLAGGCFLVARCCSPVPFSDLARLPNLQSQRPLPKASGMCMPMAAPSQCNSSLSGAADGWEVQSRRSNLPTLVALSSLPRLPGICSVFSRWSNVLDFGGARR